MPQSSMTANTIMTIAVTEILFFDIAIIFIHPANMGIFLHISEYMVLLFTKFAPFHQPE